MPRMYVGGTCAIDASLGLRRQWRDARCSTFTHLLLAARDHAALAVTVALKQQLGGRSNAGPPRRPARRVRSSPSRRTPRVNTQRVTTITRPLRNVHHGDPPTCGFDTTVATVQRSLEHAMVCCSPPDDQ